MIFESKGPIVLDVTNIEAMKEIETKLKQGQAKGTLYHFYCWRDLSDFKVFLDFDLKIIFFKFLILCYLNKKYIKINYQIQSFTKPLTRKK